MKKLFRGLFLTTALGLVLTGCGTDQQTGTKPVEKETDNGVVAMKEFPTDIAPVEDYSEAFPAHVASFMKNAEMEETTYGGSVPVDYLVEYPYLTTFYKGYVFEKQYDRARGHVYALEDVVNTKRPKASASCLACKVSIYDQELLKDPSVSSMDFHEFMETHHVEGFTCFDCHGDTPGEVQVNRYHINKALENNPEEEYLDGNILACAQCHVEYYLTPDEKLVQLPWDHGLGADEAYAYYQEKEFYDWEHELTGAKVLKAQHPEVETYYGSVHQELGMDCMACHMPQVEVEGEKITSHHWTSPLKYPEESCLKCHTDQTADEIIKMAEDVQKPVVEKTDAVGKELEGFINKLADIVQNNKADEGTIAQLQDIHREAQFYWDYVFVENSEGFHNQQKSLDYLNHSEELVQKGNKIIESI